MDKAGIFDSPEDGQELLPYPPLVFGTISPKRPLDVFALVRVSETNEVMEIAVWHSLDVKEHGRAFDRQVRRADDMDLGLLYR
jgi:hypothetical protein